MKKIVILIALIIVTGSVNAGEVILKCRTSGFVDYKVANAYSINCGSLSEYNCKQQFERQLEKKFVSLSKACKKALGGEWYHDKTLYKY